MAAPVRAVGLDLSAVGLSAVWDAPWLDSRTSPTTVRDGASRLIGWSRSQMRFEVASPPEKSENISDGRNPGAETSWEGRLDRERQAGHLHHIQRQFEIAPQGSV